MNFQKLNRFVTGLTCFAFAAQCWGSSLELVRTAQDAEKAGDRKGALAAYGRAIEAGDLTPPQSAFVHYRSGALHGYLGENLAAIDDLSASIALDPKRGAALGMRGYLRGVVGQYAAAAKDFEAALGLAKSQTWAGYQPWVLQTRADLYRRERKFAEALADCELALAPGPNAMVNFRRALVYVDMGRVAEAKADYEKFEQAVASKDVSYDALWPDERKALDRLRKLR